LTGGEGGGRRNVVFVNTNKQANDGYYVVIERMNIEEEDEIVSVSYNNNNDVGSLYHPRRLIY
jgi:hypothetical protein